MKNSLNNCDMEELYNKALNICRLFIGAILVVTDEQINTAIEQVSFIPDFKMLDKHILKKKLLAHYGVRIQDFQERLSKISVYYRRIEVIYICYAKTKSN